MINWIIWFWALLCPNPNHTPGNHGNCTLLHSNAYNTLEDDGDTGDETGNFPPKPPGPPPPPPPPPGGGG